MKTRFSMSTSLILTLAIVLPCLSIPDMSYGQVGTICIGRLIVNGVEQEFGCRDIFDGQTGTRTPDPPRRTPDPPRRTPDPPRTLSITTDFKGAGGGQKPLTVTATNPDGNPVPGVSIRLSVTFGGGTVSPSTVTTGSNGTAQSTLTRGNTPGHNYFVTATASGYREASSRISISAPLPTPDLVVDSPQISKTTLAPGESFTFSATVRNADEGPGSATTLKYWRSSDSTDVTEAGTAPVSALDSKGTTDVSTQLTAPTAPGTYTYFACISSVARESNTDNNCTRSVRITVGVSPAKLMIASGDNQGGVPNTELTDPLVVKVLDADGNGVENVGVDFRVATGQGRLSSRDNGQTVYVTTNSEGFAEVPFTPTSAGTLTVEASIAGLDPVVFTVNAGPPPAKLVKVSGDTQHGKPGTRLTNPFAVEVQDKDSTPMEGITVTFRVTAGGGKLSATTVTTGENGRAQTFLTLGTTHAVNQVQASVSRIDTPVTFRTSIEAIVLIAADQRPPMYWVADTGTLHRLVGAKVENLLPSVQNATSLTVDVAGGKLYWTEKTGTRTGNIRAANLNGTNVALVKRLTSVPSNLTLDPAMGKLYLTNAWGKVQRLNVDGSRFEPNLITDLTDLKDMAVDVAGGKLYWIEQTGERRGNIRAANLDGTNVRVVKDLTSVPYSLAVDAANRKLYLTNAWGKIQRLNVDGSRFEPNLITGLDAPEGVTVDAQGGKVYWTEQGSLRRADLNGETVEDVITGLGTVSSLALATTPVDNGGPAAPTAIASVSGETALLANYPNPFNPETWIPYQLETSAEVTLTIYAVDGQAVRQLELGHQAAGAYQSRSRAAYWDGRNEYGEPVASGLYFYTLTTGDFSATRKMLIRK